VRKAEAYYWQCVTRALFQCISGHVEQISVFHYADFLTMAGSLSDWTKVLDDLILKRFVHPHDSTTHLHHTNGACGFRACFMWFEDVSISPDPTMYLNNHRRGTYFFRLSQVCIHASMHLHCSLLLFAATLTQILCVMLWCVPMLLVGSSTYHFALCRCCRKCR
jgi:hypothetical protein